MKSGTELTLAELARQGDVTPRTVRYYITQGLLPGPGGQTGSARYGISHLDRIRLIKRLQQSHLPLADIRARLSALEDEDVADLIAEPQELAPPAQGERALSYIRELLATSTPQEREVAGLQYAARSMVTATPARMPAPALAPPPSPSSSSSKPSAPERSTWERIALSPDIEIHVRRPLDRQSNKDLDQLLALARELFKRP